ALVGAGVDGMGVHHALQVALWLLSVLALITIGQRLKAVYDSANSFSDDRDITESQMGARD
ncbi:MAG: hypothetical protein ACREP9_02990, partial [Candidatus Dormibacteraceae bacterium]